MDKNKEFMLDILERTVLFVRHLVHEVDRLEKQASPSYKNSTDAINTTNSLKRPHEEVDEEMSGMDGDYVSMRDDDDEETESDTPPSQVAAVGSTTTTNPQTIQLPSISSWLENMDVKPFNHHRQPTWDNLPSAAMSPLLEVRSTYRREISME